MRLVQQEDEWGCGVAVLAMLTERTYEIVKAELAADSRRAGHDWSKHGLYWSDLERYLAMAGWWSLRLYAGWHLDSWPPEPFAERHWALVRQPSGNSHFVAMASDGLVLDPLRCEPCHLSDFLKVDQVTGLRQLGGAR